MKGHCRNCGCTHEIKPSYSGKLIAAGLTTMLAKRTVKNPLVTFGLVMISTVAGHYIDKKISEKCPECGAILQIIATV